MGQVSEAAGVVMLVDWLVRARVFIRMTSQTFKASSALVQTRMGSTCGSPVRRDGPADESMSPNGTRSPSPSVAT